MARKLITDADSIQERLFLADGRGLRGINLLRSSGPRGYSLSVAVHSSDGKRRQINTFSLKGKDFNAQWERAVATIAEYYGINQDSPLYGEMIAAAHAFRMHYGITLRPVVTTFAQAEFDQVGA